MSRKLKEFTKNIWLWLSKQTKESESAFVPLGILFFLGYLSWYILWHFVEIQAYENLNLRLVGSLLGLPLIFKNFWIKRFSTLVPIYWYGTLIYLIPFFFSFMLFKNNFSTVWQLNGITALVLLILVTDWISVGLIILIGVSIGWFAYTHTTPHSFIPNNLFSVIANYLAIVLFCGLFMYRRSKVQQEKLQSMSTLSASIAHELRTPLRAIKSGLNGIKKYLPDLIHGYQLAKKANLPVTDIHPTHYKALQQVINTTTLEAESAFTVINMLLVKLNQSDANPELKEYSIMHCVEEALNRYPFNPGERELISWNNTSDFSFKGDELLMIHILYNLLKNAIYYIKVVNKGSISIWLEPGSSYNKLHFKDTGKGISHQDLPHIFDKFFSKTQHGTGIGLAFCKLVMQSFNGQIKCESIDGEFTEFILGFPTLKDLTHKTLT